MRIERQPVGKLDAFELGEAEFEPLDLAEHGEKHRRRVAAGPREADEGAVQKETADFVNGERLLLPVWRVAEHLDPRACRTIRVCVLGDARPRNDILVELLPGFVDPHLIERMPLRARFDHHPPRLEGELRAEPLPRKLVGVLTADAAQAEPEEASEPSDAVVRASEVHPAAVVRHLEDVAALVLRIGNLDARRSDLPGARVGDELADEVQRVLALLDKILEDRHIVAQDVDFFRRASEKSGDKRHGLSLHFWHATGYSIGVGNPRVTQISLDWEQLRRPAAAGDTVRAVVTRGFFRLGIPGSCLCRRASSSCRSRAASAMSYGQS